MSAKRFVLLPLLAVFMLFQADMDVPAQDPVKVKVAAYMQNVSVTVRSNRGSGSGTLVQTKDGQIWIWTAGHVVSGLRNTRVVIDEKGSPRLKVEFDDAKVLRFNKDKVDGRIVSNYTGDAELIRYSDPEYGHDLALLRLRDKDFKAASTAKFYLDKDLPDIGDDLYHCGSLLGPFGSNSLTSGILSQHGRVLDGKIYDQTTSTSFPGSSGGIVALKSDGRYVGMLVMGAGEGFGLIVPVRRMQQWAKQVGVEFALNPAIAVPTDEVLRSKPVEDSAFPSTPAGAEVAPNPHKQRLAAGLKFMMYDQRDELAQTPATLKQWFARPGLFPVPKAD